jgi:hypothetical protein
MARLTQEQAEQVYNILLRYGVTDDARTKHRFVEYFTASDRWGHEYRFCGIFGMGGKVRLCRHDGVVTADMYRENETPELIEQMDKLNKELSAFKGITE